MPRRRVAVALLPPHELSQQVQGLRRVLDDPRLDQVPPHLTLVPPINLSAPDLAALRLVLRAAASRTAPFDLALGPCATFAPATPTLHLEVGGDLVPLAELRARIHVEPVARPDQWPFVAHVTLRESMPESLLRGALDSLTATLGTWTVDRLHLLEQFRDADGVRWRPVAEEPFGGPDVVGRGGVELALRTVEMYEPEVEALMEGTGVAPFEPAADGRTLVVAAELPDGPGAPVAAACGRAGPGAAELVALHVAEGHRGMGVGRHVLARWCIEAARRGAGVAVADPAVADGVLVRWGFVPVGTRLVRQLAA